MRKKFLVLFIIISVFIPHISYAGINTKVTKAATQIQDDRMIPDNPKRPISNLSPWNGDYVYFGWRNKESMRWRVLRNDGKNLLLLSDRTIGSMPYHDVSTLGDFEYTYESATIRKWLNDDFIKQTFTAKEREYLLKNRVSNGDSNYAGVASGPDTEDEVYMLSYNEMRKAKYGFWPTGSDTNSRRFYDQKGYLSSVWTRSLQSEFNSYGDHYSYPWWVQENGSLSGRGAFFTNPVTWTKGILPVIKIPISCPFWSNDAQEYDESMGSDELEPLPKETPKPNENKWKITGLDFEYDIPEEIPVLGGGTASIDLKSKLPIQFSQDGNKFRIAIGVEMTTKDENQGGKGLFDLDVKEWKSFKKWAEGFKNKQQEDINKSIKNLKDATKKGKIFVPGEGLSKKASMNVAGFCEGTIENGKVTVASSGMYLRISVKGSVEQQLIVIHVPVVLKAEGTVEAAGEYSINMDMSRMEMYTSSDVEVSLPKVKVSGGVGVSKIADVSAYGSFDNKLKIQGTDRSSAERDENKISLTFFGEGGVSVTALMFEYEKALWSANDGKGWEYWNSVNGFLPNKNKKLIRSYAPTVKETDFTMQEVRNPSEWYPVEQKARDLSMPGISQNSRLLQKGVYSKPDVRMAVTEDGTKMMVYVSEQPGREKGNHTAVVYSLWDELEEKWSSPKIVEDDGTADFHPDIKAVGNDIYVAWTDTSRDDFSEDTEFSEMALNCEISVAKYNRSSGTFVTTKISDNSYFDCRPSLGTWQDGTVGVIWTRAYDDEKQEDALLNMSGTNKVVYSLYNKGIWENEIVAASFEGKAPFSAGMGQIGNNDCIAFLLETNEDNEESDNIELYIAEKGVNPKKIELEDEPEESLQFNTLCGEKMLTWYGNHVIYYMNNKSGYADELAQDSRITSDYRFLSDENTAILLFSNATDKEEGTELYGCVSKDSSLFFAPIQLTEEGGYINGFDGVIENDELKFVFGKDEIAIDDDILNRTVSINESSVNQYHDISITSCEMEEEEIRISREINFDGIIGNNGFYEENNPTLRIECDGEKIAEGTINNSVWMGQEMRFYGSVTIPENIEIKKGSVITFTVLPAEGEDPTMENNVFQYVVEQTDLELTIDEDNLSSGIIGISAQNYGIYDVDAILNIRDSNSDGEIIKTIDLGTLAGGEEKSLEISEDELLDGCEGRLVYLELVSGEKEKYESNNVYSNYFGKYVDKPQETISPEPTDTTGSDGTPPPFGTPIHNEPITAQLTKPPVPTQKPTPTAIPALKKLKLSSVKCLKKTKKITGKVSVSKTSVKIKVGSKAYKKAVVKGNKFTLKLNYKLKKKTKITIKVSKKGYKSLTKSYKVR